MSADHPYIDQHIEVSTERARTTEKSTFHNALQQPICDIEATYEAAPYDTETRILRGLSLHHPTNGSSINIATLTGFQFDGPECRTTVYIRPGTGNVADHAGRSIGQQPLESPVEIGVLLHEIRHIHQSSDIRFAELRKQTQYLMDATMWSGRGGLRIDTEAFQKALELFPELTLLLDDTEMQQYLKQIASMEQLETAERTARHDAATTRHQLSRFWRAIYENKKLDPIKKYLPPLQEIRQKDAVHEMQWSAWRDIRQSLPNQPRAQTFARIAETPINIMERDATLWAFRWMRRIRDKTDINLFQPVLQNGKETSVMILSRNLRSGYYDGRRPHVAMEGIIEGVSAIPIAGYVRPTIQSILKQ